jgi:hypothetical protein
MQMNLTPNGFTRDIVVLVTQSDESIAAFREHLDQFSPEAKPKALQETLIRSLASCSELGACPSLVRQIVGRAMFEEVDWSAVVRSLDSHFAGRSQGSPRFSVN